MEFKEFIAASDDAGRRFDRVIRKLFRENGLSSLYKAMRTGTITLNGKKSPPDAIVQHGDVIAVAAALYAHSRHLPMGAVPELPEPFSAVFCNEHLLVLNKPYGVPTHGARSVAAALAETAARPSLSFRPAPLHRLDRRTTGLLVCAQSIAGARWFSAALAAHCVQKTYLAIVEGALEHPGEWHDAVKKNPAERSRFHTVSLSPHGKCASTAVTPVAFGTLCAHPVTLIRCTIATGRTHQIRAQAAAHGYPLLGDTAYGARALPYDTQLFLHAHTLSFPENTLCIPATLTAPVPDTFLNAAETCRIDLRDCTE
ncbi:MAG: RluA family pseudouridine synthase [Treponema sp.]|nr:RluA family pseudouridine synthase [Treponema sp.]